MSKRTFLSLEDFRAILEDEVRVHGSAVAVAEAYKLTQPEISRVRNGMRPPKRMLRAFGLTLEYGYRVADTAVVPGTTRRRPAVK